jgi:glycerol transport system ATP-binding protein
MNLLEASALPVGLKLARGPVLSLALPPASSGALTVGMRASALRVTAQDGDVTLVGKVELAEISGTDTFVHFETALGELVAQLTGVHHFDLGQSVTFYFNPAQVYVFDAEGLLLLAPARGQGR